MDKEASQSLEIAHSRLEALGTIAASSADDKVQLMQGIATVVYHVGYAIVHQLATGPDK